MQGRGAAIDVVYRNGTAATIPDPDLNLTAPKVSFDPSRPGEVRFTVLNQGTGDAHGVVLTGTAPAGLTITGTSEPTLCSVTGADFTCRLPDLLAGQSQAITVNLTTPEPGSFAFPAQVASDDTDANTTDNIVTAEVVAVYDEGGGCTAANSPRPLDPVLPALGLLGLIGWGLRRVRGH